MELKKVESMKILFEEPGPGLQWMMMGPAPGREFYPYITSDFYAMEQALLAARNYARWLAIWGVLD